MGAALSILILLIISVFVMRVASVALRHTGMTETTARFQALSAFTGTGFTTQEAEMVINYPVRRRIIAALIITGNMGLVTVLATVVASFVHTDGEVTAVLSQFMWLVGGVLLLWVLMLNETADRVLCDWIGGLLESRTFLGRRRFHRLLQVGVGYSVCEHPCPAHSSGDPAGSTRSRLDELNLSVLGVRSPDGGQVDANADLDSLTTDHALILFGPDSAHEALGGMADTTEFDQEGETQ